jgi:hypothetical protein
MVLVGVLGLKDELVRVVPVYIYARNKCIQYLQHIHPPFLSNTNWCTVYKSRKGKRVPIIILPRAFPKLLRIGPCTTHTEAAASSTRWQIVVWTTMLRLH